MALPTNISLLRDSHTVKEGVLLDFPLNDPRWPLRMNVGHGVPTFLRGSVGTYLGKDGLIHRAEKNLLVQSEDLTTTWAVGTNETSVVANQAIAPDGTKTADLMQEATTGAQVHFLRYSSPGHAVNTQYTMSVYAKKGERGWIMLRALTLTAEPVAWFDVEHGAIGTVETGLTAAIEEIGNGWYRCSVTYTTTGTIVYDLVDLYISREDEDWLYAGEVGKGVYLWGAQLVVGPVPAPYAKTVGAASGALRIDHDADGNSLGALLESQRTNSLQYSEEFNQWLTSAVTVTSNAGTAPDGTLTADSAADTTGAIGSVYQTITCPNDSAYWAGSVFLKKVSSRFACIRVAFSGGSGLNYDVVVDLDNGGCIIGPSSTPTDYGVREIGGGWYRFFVTGQNNSTGNTSASFCVFPAWNSAFLPWYDQNATGSVLAWGGQLELCSYEYTKYATSYIPTGAAAVTRSEDKLSVQSYGNAEVQTGSAFMELDLHGKAGVNCALTGETGGQIFAFHPNQYCYAGAASLDGAVIPTNDTTHRVATTWDGDTKKIIGNGGAVYSNASFVGALFAGSILRIGDYQSGGTISINGHIRFLKIWGRALAESEMRYLTEFSLEERVTLDAPFDDPANPTTLLKGIGIYNSRDTTATFLNPTTGLLESASSGKLRIEKEGALIEGQRTNLLTRSMEFEHGNWNASGNVTANLAVAPDGQTTGDRVNPGVAVYQFLTVTAVAHTFTIYAKKINGRYFRMWFVTSGYGKGGRADYDLLSGVAYDPTNFGSTTGTTCSIADAGNGWWRCSLTVTATAEQYFAQFSFTDAEQGYVWGAQLEVGGFATSLIPTTSAAVTRNIDDVVFYSTRHVSRSHGSCTLEVGLLPGSPGSTMAISWGTGERILFYNGPDYIDMYDGTNWPMQYFGATGTHKKVACAWGNGNLRTAIGGTAGTPGSFVGIFATMGLWLFLLNGSCGHIRALKFYDRVLSENSMVRATQ